MPSLIQSLQTRDLGHLRIVAGLWGVELGSAEYAAALKELGSALLDADLVGEMVDSLSTEAQSALKKLLDEGGKMPWAAFARQFGEIREAGPGKRDREQIHLNPASAAETLFYRAFLARAFFDSASGAQEFAYIPEDLANLIKPESHEALVGIATPPPGRPATVKEYAQPMPASDRILDDATTCLAALRLGREVPEMQTPVIIVKELLEAAGIVNGETSHPEQVKAFLEMSRLQALAVLTKAWRQSEVLNDLHMLPGLVCEGEWNNQPLATRSFLFHLLEALPQGKWWNLTAFVLGIRKSYPDFQRPAGDYDSWFVKRSLDGTYLRGFEYWDEVDGALLRYLLTGPMFWLGMVELATPAESDAVSAFRVNKNPSTSSEKAKLTVASNGRISVPRLVPRVNRYLIARFCEWEDSSLDEYHYRVTTGSLKLAAKQGLHVGQLLSLLAKNAAGGIPPAFVKALKRWEANGSEARVEAQTILRVSRPEVLEELRKSKAERFLGERLVPVAVIVKPGAQVKVQAALAELGLLAEMKDGEK